MISIGSNQFFYLQILRSLVKALSNSLTVSTNHHSMMLFSFPRSSGMNKPLEYLDEILWGAIHESEWYKSRKATRKPHCIILMQVFSFIFACLPGFVFFHKKEDIFRSLTVSCPPNFLTKVPFQAGVAGSLVCDSCYPKEGTSFVLLKQQQQNSQHENSLN